jgi:serine/threonine protein kinase
MDHYKSISELGQGSFGSVFLVKDIKDRPFALKKIHVSPFDIDQALKEI